LDLLVVSVQWLHVLLGIFWLGSALFLNLVLFPALMRLPLPRVRDTAELVIERADRFIAPAAAFVIIMGVVRGLVGGRIDELGDLTQGYGLIWITAFVVGIATYSVGFVTVRRLQRLFRETELWMPEADGRPTAALTARIGRIQKTGMLELVGFMILLTTMVLMRFS
jgi:uncharacterized membrane protein